jgi:hypothetical protein
MCISINKQEKYKNKQRPNYNYNFASNKQICMKKNDVFEDAKENRCEGCNFF